MKKSKTCKHINFKSLDKEIGFCFDCKQHFFKNIKSKKYESKKSEKTS